MPSEAVDAEPIVNAEAEYARHRWLLYFEDPEAEAAYGAVIVERALRFCRIAWAGLIVMVSIFGLLDHLSFPGALAEVRASRFVVGASGVVMLAISYSRKHQRLLVLSAPAFICVVGIFSAFLLALSDATTASLYFVSPFFAFCGVLITPGVGFRSSVVAIAVTMLAVLFALGMWNPVGPTRLAIYMVFIGAFAVVFGFIGHFVERQVRDNYVVSARLQASLERCSS